MDQKQEYPISNGVDVAQFNPTSKQINEFTQQFHISEEDKLVISVGWLFEYGVGVIITSAEL